MPEVTVVAVPAEQSWPCDICGHRRVVAYVVTDAEETHGYCPNHLTAAIMAEFNR